MWKAYQRYRALDPEARKLFRSAAYLLPRTTASLRLRGFKKTKQSLQSRLLRTGVEVGSKENEPKVVAKTCRMVKAAARYGIVRATCLEESLVLWYLLQKQNVQAHLRIGVRKLPEEFEAHAWVEFQGQALNQTIEHLHYAAFEDAFSEMPGDKS
jgi:hypothetical protein